MRILTMQQRLLSMPFRFLPKLVLPLVHATCLLSALFLGAAPEVTLPSKSLKIGRLTIDDRSSGISDATWIYVRAALQTYRKEKPDALIIELNTPGGEVYAAQRISDALKELHISTGIPTVAYINTWAVSAGAMIAYSCKYIVPAQGSIMGAAEPVNITTEGMKEASEKVNSAIRSDFASRAQFFGRNPAIAEAMVDPDVILVLRNGQVIKLDSMDQIKHGEEKVISAKGKLLTLTSQEMVELGVADAIVAPFSNEIAAQLPLEEHPLRELGWAHPEKMTIDTYQMNWQTRVIAFLAQPAVSSLLFMGFLVGAYIEFTTPGVFLPGLVSFLSLFCLGLVSFSQEAITYLDIILIGFGGILFALEIIFFPTAGVMGVIGGLFLLVGVGALILPGLQDVRFDGNSLNAAGEYVLSRVAWFFIAFCFATLLAWWITRRLQHKPQLARWLILTEGIQPPLVIEQGEPTVALGTIGVIVSTLRPSGKVEIEGRLYDAISSGEYMEAGEKVRVVEVGIGKIVVIRNEERPHKEKPYEEKL